MRSDSGTTSETCFGEEFGSIWAPFWTPEAPKTIKNRFRRASECSLELRSIFDAILAQKVDPGTPRYTQVDLAGGMRRAAVRRSRSVICCLKNSVLNLTRCCSPGKQGAADSIAPRIPQDPSLEFLAPSWRLLGVLFEARRK